MVGHLGLDDHETQHESSQLSRRILYLSMRHASCSECTNIYFPQFTLQLTLLGRFYAGCSTFLSVFDSRVDTFDALHHRSPFAVDAICMVGARVRDGGGQFVLDSSSPFTIYSQERQAKHITDLWMQFRTYRVLLSSLLCPE